MYVIEGKRTSFRRFSLRPNDRFRILCSLWCSELSPAFVLFERFARSSRTRIYDRSSTPSFQLCSLCFTCLRKSVSVARIAVGMTNFSFLSLGVVFRPDSSISTITLEERDRFTELRERLRQFLESQVTNFRFVRSSRAEEDETNVWDL